MTGVDERHEDFSAVLANKADLRTRQIEHLQQQLERETDARREERFVFIVLIVLLLDVVFFSVMDSFGGPIALLILELLVLIPLANRMGMQEIAKLYSRVLDRLAGRNKSDG